MDTNPASVASIKGSLSARCVVNIIIDCVSKRPNNEPITMLALTWLCDHEIITSAVTRRMRALRIPRMHYTLLVGMRGGLPKGLRRYLWELVAWGELPRVRSKSTDARVPWGTIAIETEFQIIHLMDPASNPPASVVYDTIVDPLGYRPALILKGIEVTPIYTLFAHGLAAT